ELTKKQNDLKAQRDQLTAAGRALESLLDWHTWTVDRLDLQAHRREVYLAFRGPAPQDEKRREDAWRPGVGGLRGSPGVPPPYPGVEKGLDAIFTKLSELADSASMYGTLRQLQIPEKITVYYQAEHKRDDGKTPLERRENHKFTFNLAELNDSV